VRVKGQRKRAHRPATGLGKGARPTGYGSDGGRREGGREDKAGREGGSQYLHAAGRPEVHSSEWGDKELVGLADHTLAGVQSRVDPLRALLSKPKPRNCISQDSSRAIPVFFAPRLSSRASGDVVPLPEVAF